MAIGRGGTKGRPTSVWVIVALSGLALSLMIVGAGSALVRAGFLTVSNGTGPSAHQPALAAVSARRTKQAAGTTTTTTSRTGSGGLSLGGGALQSEVDAALAGTRACAIVMDGPTPVVEDQPSAELAPASTQKLLLAAATLSALGPDYRFRTDVVSDAPVVGGVLGQAWLVGSGDPMLATPDYAAYLASRPRWKTAPVTAMASLADQLAARGIRSVPGGIHGDDAALSQQRYLPTWSPADRGEGDISPVSALTVDEGWQTWVRAYHPVPDPPAAGAARLAGLLVAQGVASGPTAPDGAAPPGAVVVASVTSAPLAQIVAFMLRSSDNVTAEVLTRVVGLKVVGTGTTEAGTAAVLQVDQRLGIPTAGLELVDGSGLSASNRVTCSALLGALDLAGQPGFEAIGQGLAVPGQSGTLASRFLGTPEQTHLAAKTGSINGVAAMVGVLDLAQPLRFAVVADGSFSYAGGTAVEDKVVAALAAYRAPQIGSPPDREATKSGGG